MNVANYNSSGAPVLLINHSGAFFDQWIAYDSTGSVEGTLVRSKANPIPNSEHEIRDPTKTCFTYTDPTGNTQYKIHAARTTTKIKRGGSRNYKKSPTMLGKILRGDTSVRTMNELAISMIH